MSKLINISELSKLLDLIDPITNKPLNHILRYWEKEFSEIKPKKINNHRYYTKKNVEILKLIKYLIKDQKISIAGVKKILKSEIKKLDDNDLFSLRNKYLKAKIKNKTKNILNKISLIKKYGKKNTS
mgnify:FL=1|tara:strand:+ start:3225 stop:3605 length:381 start_codon:yes stop_codon:yes gene_type:complete